MQKFWVGGYGPEGDGTLLGIGQLSAEGGPKTLRFDRLKAGVASPSWLAKRGNRLYAALEFNDAVHAFDLTDDDSIVPLGERVPVGAGVCHITATAQALIACAYGDGTVSYLQLDGQGVPSAPVNATPATDPYPAETRQSRAHASAILPDGRVATTDLGFDLVRIWSIRGGELHLDQELPLPQGVAPRHLKVHPSGHVYVNTEYANDVFVLGADPSGQYRIVSSTAPLGLPGDYSAEISISPDGYTVWVGLRGSNTIQALRVSDAGTTLTPTALVDSGVDWPRFHLEHEGALLVAGQRSNTVSVLDVDSRGIPGTNLTTVDVPTPTSIVVA